MQKRISSSLFLLFSLPLFLAAQQNNGCDGQRYRQDAFSATTKKTVQYAVAKDYGGGTINLSVDVYQPVGDDAAVARPVLIFAHGGSFVTGDRTQMAAWCQAAAKKGYVAATMQYRLYPWFLLGFPDSTQIMDAACKATFDMKACVRFFRKDAAAGNQFKIDPNLVFIGGYSAGAVTADLAGYMNLDDDLPAFVTNIVEKNGGIEGDTGDSLNHTFSSKAKLVMSMSGGLYRKEWLDANEPPFFGIHGTADDVVPYTSGLAANVAHLDGSSLLRSRADAVGLQNHLETCTGADHVNMYGATSPFAPQVANFVDKASAAMQEIICGTTSADDIFNEKSNWSVFPNPTSGDFSVRWNENLATADLQIFDLAGRQIFSQKNVQNGSQIQTLKLGSGMFFVKISASKTVKKIVVE